MKNLNLQVPLLVHNGVGTLFSCVPAPLQPWLDLFQVSRWHRSNNLWAKAVYHLEQLMAKPSL